MPSHIDPHSPQITKAIARLGSDPNLSGEASVRTLRWASDGEPRGEFHWLDWLADLMSWLSQSGRVIVWIAAFILAGLLALYLVRLSREMRRPRFATHPTIPSHVRELDIRPESLPADIGAAARELWQRGERRGALSLLYRGLLSRLVHVHGIAIRESSTEGDCLQLLLRQPSPYRNEYAGRLVRTWQRAVYGAQEPDDALALELCGAFGAALDTASAPHREPKPA